MSDLISVVIPTHNEAKVIGVALESLIKQTYENIEILVIDDGSTDNTKGIVENYMKTDKRIQYFKLPYEDKKRKNWRGYDINGGYLARNYGFKLAKGVWIACQDADDASFLNRIEIQHFLATKFNATLITTEWMQLHDSLVHKKFDLDRFLKEKNIEEIMVPKEKITALAKRSKGVLMKRFSPHNWIPFPIKWFPPTRKLFFKSLEGYPGADNSMFFKRDVTQKVLFRQRDKRVWPSPSGRGSGRDFVMQVAETFENSIAFMIPVYLWRVKNHENHFAELKEYLF